MTEILSIRRKTLSNQSNNQSHNTSILHKKNLIFEISHVEQDEISSRWILLVVKVNLIVFVFRMNKNMNLVWCGIISYVDT